MNRAKHEQELEAALWLMLRRQGSVLARDPTAARWMAWRSEMADKLRGPLIAVYVEAAGRINGKLRAGLTAAVIERRAGEWAAVYSIQLAGLITTTSQQLTVEALMRVQAGDATRQGALAAVFSPARAEGIAVTEVSVTIVRAEKDVAGEANRQLAARALEDPEATRELVVPFWVTRPEKSQTGPCSICAPLNGKPEWEWPLELRDGPPAHPNCVCPPLDWRIMPLDQVPTVSANYAA